MSHSKDSRKKQSTLDNILGFERIRKAYIRDKEKVIDRVIEPEVMDNLEAAKAYDEAALNSTAPLYRVITKIATSLLNKNVEDPLVVDFGSGSARFVCMMAQAISKMKAQGSELSDAMLDLALSNIRDLGLENRISISKANCTKDDFIEPGTADLSTSIWVAHHLSTAESITNMIKLMNRLTKTKGSIFIFDLIRPPSTEIIDMLVKDISNGNELFDLDLRNSLQASLTAHEWEDILKKSDTPDLNTYILQPFPLLIAICKIGENINGAPVTNKELPPYKGNWFKRLIPRFKQYNIEKGFRKGGMNLL